MKTSELIGPALDWAVAECEGVDLQSFLWAENQRAMDEKLHYYNYSTNWLSGGPLIERERMTVEFFEDGHYKAGGAWLSTAIKKPYFNEEIGETPLIAAMRCYVASRLGEEVSVPAEFQEAA